MKASDFAELLGLPDLDQSLTQVASHLDTALSGTDALVEPGLRVVHGGGKRLRPLLTIASAVACDPATKLDPLDARVVRGAVAVELVHVGSLVHDDIMDLADSRRGVPTVNAVEGPNRAILVGDFLLARAGVEAALVSSEVALSLATTLSDLCDGQSLETVHEFDTNRSIEDALTSIDGKTAALLRASCDIGALCVEAQQYAEALGDYGRQFGLAFQLVDDLLDLVSSEELMGKPVNNDVRVGVYTVPTLIALDLASDREAFEAALREARSSDEAAADLGRTIIDSGAVQETIKRVHIYNGLARSALDALPESPTKSGLQELPNRYLADILQERSIVSIPGI